MISSLPLRFPKVRLNPSKCSIYYGGPGSGKTTMAAWLAIKYQKAGYSVFSNVPIKGCFILDKSDIGRYSIPSGSFVIIDEAGVEYNNRDFARNFSGSGLSKKSGQTFSPLEWWKKHRHEGCEVAVFSQGFDDMDLKIRGLASHYYIVRRSLLPGMISVRAISKAPRIDKDTHQPIDMYDYLPLGRKFIFKRPCWPYFDSFDKMDLRPRGR